MEIFGHMLQALIDPQLVIYLAVGVFLGIYIGAVPGLSVTMAASLLISFTYSWDVLPWWVSTSAACTADPAPPFC